MPLKVLFLFICILLHFSQESFARQPIEVGNGGFGKVVNGKLLLLDFADAALDETAYVDTSIKPATEIVRIINENLGHFSDLPVNLLAQKIQEIEQVDILFANVLLNTMGQHLWMFPYELDRISEDPRTIHDQDSLIQLAVRRGKSIFIGQKTWEQLDDINKIGLIFHEIVYAIMPFEKINEDGCIAQVPYKVRDVIASIFYRAYQASSLDRHYNFFKRQLFNKNDLLLTIRDFNGFSITQPKTLKVIAPFTHEDKLLLVDDNLKNQITEILLQSQGRDYEVLSLVIEPMVNVRYQLVYEEDFSCGKMISRLNIIETEPILELKRYFKDIDLSTIDNDLLDDLVNELKEYFIKPYRF